MKSEFPDKTQRMAVCSAQGKYSHKGSQTALRASLAPVSAPSRSKYSLRVSVSQKAGVMKNVSLLQVGEAKGHGIWIDDNSLSTALESLLGKNLPAHITHAGAIEEDRMLRQIGFFSQFYVEEAKLKAKQFSALQSFQDDEPERYRRLFDLASEMPDTFGLSLVFEANLVWVFEDGSEKLISESDGKDAVREIPSVRFSDISSADFVDAPAANRDGLFSKPTATGVIDMDDDNDTQAEIELAEEEVPEEVTPEEEADEEKVDEELDEQEEINKLRDDIGQHDDRLNNLEDAVADLKSKLGASKEETEKLQEENKKLSQELEGSEPLRETFSDPRPPVNVLKKLESSDGEEGTRFFQKNKETIFEQYNKARRAK